MAEEEQLPVFMDVTLDGSWYERMVFELFYDIVPFTAENFRALCTGEKGVSPKAMEYLCYGNCFFHKVKKRSSYVKGGALCYETGKVGESIFGPHFPAVDSNDLKHDREGLLSMPRSDRLAYSSSFIITLKADESLDSSHVVFGKVVQGIGTIWNIAKHCNHMGIKIMNCGVLYNANDIPPGVVVRSSPRANEDERKKLKRMEDKKNKKLRRKIKAC